MTRYPARPVWTTTVVPVAASALVLLLAGCGGSGDNKSTSASAPSNAASGGGDAGKAYTDCLRANGVEVPTGRPDGGTRPPGAGRPSGRPSARPSRPAGERPTGFPSGRPAPRATDPAYRKAEEACAKWRPTRGPGGGTDGPRRGADSAAQAFAGCLKDHRVELPAGGAAALDRSDPKVAEALKICQALLPTAPTAGAGTPTAVPTT
ncbi:hypothetical protein [Embleya scabrispora]|uniref:hypothetical protein n=1 Tax=Embleya scabrispora TaxID=159449 RepID=UPI001319E72F|nr:hypothetical protein [Embleya scabrispora]MYS83701.1 hypothetical protein [Streptomyces sp. SID5474]